MSGGEHVTNTAHSRLGSAARTTLEDGLPDRLRRFVERRVRNRHDGEDLVQEVLLKWHAHRAELPEDRRQRLAWAYRTARNAIIDYHRRRRVRAGRVREDAAELAAPSGESEQGMGCLDGMTDLLPNGYRDAIRWSDVEGMPLREVAHRLGVSVSGAKSRVQRARRQLRGMVLDCCEVTFDARGGVADYEPTARARDYCGQGCDGR